jgi:hypothetical protein
MTKDGVDMSKFKCEFDRCWVDCGSQDSLDAHIRRHTRKIMLGQDVRKNDKKVKSS